MHPEVNLGIFWLTIFKENRQSSNCETIFSSKKTRLSTSMTWCRKHVLPSKNSTRDFYPHHTRVFRPRKQSRFLCRENKKTLHWISVMFVLLDLFPPVSPVVSRWSRYSWTSWTCQTGVGLDRFCPVPSVSGFFLAWWVIGTSPVPGVCGTPFKLTLLFMPYKYGDDPNYLHQALSLSEKAIWFEPFFISRFKERWLKKPWNRAIVVGNHLLGGGFRVPTSRPHHLVCFYS